MTSRLYRLRHYASYASVSVAAVLIAAKLVAYYLTNSVALLSSLVDSTVDLMAASVTLFSVIKASQPASKHHRYGHGKAEPLAALSQAAFIVGSAVLLIYEAGARFLNHAAPANPEYGYAVMGLSILLTAALVWFQRYVIRKTGSVAITADTLHYSGDLWLNLSVIAALVLGQVTGSAWVDPLFAAGISVYLMVGAGKIARHALALLMDRELDEADRKRIIALAMSHPEARGVHDLRSRSDGDRQFVEFHLELDSYLTLATAHHITDMIETRVREAFPRADVLIHQEPAGIADRRLDDEISR